VVIVARPAAVQNAAPLRQARSVRKASASAAWPSRAMALAVVPVQGKSDSVRNSCGGGKRLLLRQDVVERPPYLLELRRAALGLPPDRAKPAAIGSTLCCRQGTSRVAASRVTWPQPASDWRRLRSGKPSAGTCRGPRWHDLRRRQATREAAMAPPRGRGIGRRDGCRTQAEARLQRNRSRLSNSLAMQVRCDYVPLAQFRTCLWPCVDR
jgi:hypothetical protein